MLSKSNVHFAARTADSAIRPKGIAILLLPLILAVTSAASATAIVAIDLSPAPGIQSMLTVLPGAPSFTASVVAYDDGSAPTPVIVISSILDVTSSATGVAALGPVATAGTLAGGLTIALDAFSFGPTPPGVPLMPGLPPGPGTLGTVGYFDLAGIGAPLPIDMTPMPTMFIDLIAFTVMPGAVAGTTTLAISPFPIAGPGGVPLVPGPLGASVTIVPVPAALLLLSSGLLGLVSLGWRRLRFGLTAASAG